MKIVLAADGSEFTAKAADYLVKHFNWFRDPPELHILHVMRPIPQGMALVQAERILGRDAVDRYYEEQSKVALSRAERILRKHNVTFQSAHRVGEIAPELCRYAGKIEADLIVMGSHGHHAIGNLLLGSITTKVLALEKNIPILIIR